MILFLLAEMSNLTVFKVFYGNGEVRHGPNGVDLSSFHVASLNVENPEEFRMKQMQRYLTQWFQLDKERYSVRVELLHTKPSSLTIWDLAHMRTTTGWLNWLRWCSHHGTEFVMLVQPCPKEIYEHTQVGESSSFAVDNAEVKEEILVQEDTQTHNAVLEGYADEGEEIGAVVALLDLVDQNALREDELLEESIAASGDADDEEEEAVGQEQDDGTCRVLLPDEWNRPNKASMVVHDGHRFQWEYGTSMIRVKQVFRNKSALKEAICLWALSSMREFWVKISSQDKYTLYCKKSRCQF